MITFKQFLEESVGGGVKTKDSKANKFEAEIASNVRSFFHSQDDEKYKKLDIEHYSGDNAKYYSDIRITNPSTSRTVWIEVKKDKNACLGSPTFKYYDREWHISSKDHDNPLSQYYLNLLNTHSEKFIQFCQNELGDDFNLPEDMVDVIDKWRKYGSIDDTDNDVNFITEKIPLENFGDKIAQYYKSVKDEPVYYIQINDDLYIIDPQYNPLNLKTHDGKDLKSISEVHKNGRVQFRAKGIEKIVDGKKKYFYSIVMDIKQTAKDNITGKTNDTKEPEDEYICSFKTREKYPSISAMKR